MTLQSHNDKHSSAGQNPHTDQGHTAVDPDTNSHGHGHTDFEKGVKNTHGRAHSLSVKGAGKTDTRRKKLELHLALYKNQFKMDQRP